jgi:hypothetical protein
MVDRAGVTVIGGTVVGGNEKQEGREKSRDEYIGGQEVSGG